MTHVAPVSLVLLLGLGLAVACSEGTSPTEAARPAFNASGRGSVGFNGEVRGFPTGAVRLTGGGSFDPATASNVVPTETTASLGGGFDCSEAVTQGPLTGCEKDQGVRWDTAQLLESTSFKCSASDTPKPATTSAHTAVLLADFYRAGDGIEESFRAQMIVSDQDLPGHPGANLWVQGVGCGTAIVNFN